jgi:hypothetical protein
MPGLYEDETLDLLKTLAADPGVQLRIGERAGVGPSAVR